MPRENTDAEAALRKLGQRVRAGHAKQHPIPDTSIETVRTTVREEWEQEQQANRQIKPGPDTSKGRQRKPPEPGEDR